METLRQDFRLAVRRIWARPTWSLIAIITLALGIGANTAVFSLVKGVLLEPLPYADPERLVMIWRPGQETDQTWLSQREWVEYERGTRSFVQLAAYTDLQANLTEGAEPERVLAARVTGNLFSTLGVSARVGRAFTPEDDAPGRSAVVLLGYHLWQRRFAGAADIVGKTIHVNGVARQIVGVMPSDFLLPLDYREERATELWIPAAVNKADAGSFGSREFFLVGRLRPGVTAQSASADLDRVGREWEAQGFINNRNGRLNRDAIPLTALLTGNLRPALLLLFGAVGFILLIACANVTNLLLARSDARKREVATQAALGASRARIARELLLESLLLALGGLALGITLAVIGLRATLALTPVNLLRMRDVSLDPAVLLFSAAIAIVATLLAGATPALELARINLQTAMNAGGRAGASTVRKRLRHALVAAQTALSVILVIGAGLLARSFIELRRVDLGFNADNVLTFRIALPGTQYDTVPRVTGFFEQLLTRIEELPGVRSAAAVRILPLTNTIGDWSITIEGRPMDPDANPNGDWQVVTPRYFETMGIQLSRGRFFTDADNASGAPVVIIDENMAERYWPGQDPLGRRFHLGTRNQPWMTIVGITKAVRHNAIVEEPRTEMFLPHAQFALQTGYAPLGMTVIVKTVDQPMALFDPARAQLRALDPSLPISEVRTLEEVAARALAQPRFLTMLLGAFAALALSLAAIGMYGVISFLTARRAQEIGVRMALGATRANVLTMIIGEGVRVAGAGVLIGIASAAALTRLLAAQLYGVKPLDPVTFAVVPIALLVVAVAGALLPARRAARTSPSVALRE